MTLAAALAPFSILVIAARLISVLPIEPEKDLGVAGGMSM